MNSVSLKINKKVLNRLKKYNLTGKNHILFVAFSGGIDSTCLLDVLFKLSEEYRFKLVAGHLNHNWRGEESKKEELNAQKFCTQRNIEFYSETLPENITQTEKEARNQRYAFFNRITELTKATAIITGHTLSDQAETVLYRIIKGTGIPGLKGIPEVRYQEKFPAIYRPVLEITREENIKYCEKNNLLPNIDSSNFQEKYLRNRIRLKLLPELKTYNSGIENALLRLASLAGDSEEIAEEYLRSINKEIYTENNVISAQKFIKLSPSVQRRILLNLFTENNIEYNYEKIRDNLNFIKESSLLKSGNTISLKENLWLFASSSEIRIINCITADKISEIIHVKPDGETFFPELNLTFNIMIWDKELPAKFPKETENAAYVDLSKIKFPLFLRTRRPGDIIQPFGMQNKTKLKKYLINKGAPEFTRDKLLLIANEEEILWIPGIGLSELLRVDNIPTHKIQVS